MADKDKIKAAALEYANSNCNGKIMPKTWQMLYDSYVAGAKMFEPKEKK